MFFRDIMGASLTLFALSMIGLAGLMTARLILKDDASDDPLAFTIAAIVCGVGEAVTIALVLGALGALRFELAIALLTALVLGLLVRVRSAFPRMGMLRLSDIFLKGAGARLKAHPALAVCALHVLVTEILRGFIQPPLSDEGLVQHLSYAAGWLQEQDVLRIVGSHVSNSVGGPSVYSSFWLWWWVAPSHSDTYAGLANLIHWILLALSVGALARQLGAKVHWPVAGFLAFLVPTVVRSAIGYDTQLIFSAYVLAGCFFASRWTLSARWSDVLLAAVAGGVAVGVDTLGVLYSVVLGLVSFALVKGGGRRRVIQVAVAGVIAASLGGFFYVHKLGTGLHLLAPWPTPFVSSFSEFAFLIDHSLAANFQGPGYLSLLVNALLGGEGRRLVPLAFGPQFILVVVAAAAIPFSLARKQLRVVILLMSCVALQVLSYVFLLPGARHQLIANTQHLLPLVGIGIAGGLAILECRGLSYRRIRVVAWVLAVQDLLLLHSVLPQGIRIAIAWADAIAFLLLVVVSSRSRNWLREKRRWIFVVFVLGGLMLIPRVVEYRRGIWKGSSVADQFSMHRFAGASRWLATHGDAGAVAIAGRPFSTATYPATGPLFERRALFVGCSKSERKEFVACSDEHVTHRIRPEEWRGRLADRGVRWVWAHRSAADLPFSREGRWAIKMFDHFILRYSDEENRIFQFNRDGIKR